jgi:integrase
MREGNKLTALGMRKLVKKPGMYGDGLGLWLQITETETKHGPSLGASWIFRYRGRQMGLGPIHTVSLADARVRARKARLAILDGGDPIAIKHEARATARIEAAKALTFRQCADAFIAAHAPTWKNAKHRQQWSATLDTYAYPVIGALPVAKIDVALVLKVLRPIWDRTPETASRLRGRIERVLDWATAQEFRTGDNPARWRGRLDAILPAKSKVRAAGHHAAMAVDDLPSFMAELREREGLAASALEFTILTSARTAEALGATWQEIDFAAKTWTIPPERMKSGKAHVVPLSPRALEIVNALSPDSSGFVFPGATPSRPINSLAMLDLLRAMRGGLTVHGFRSTFADWAGDRTDAPQAVIEMALAHAITNKTEASYRRGNALAKRVILMGQWADYCAKPESTDNVTSLDDARRVAR